MPEQAFNISGYNESAAAGTVPDCSGEKNDKVK